MNQSKQALGLGQRWGRGLTGQIPAALVVGGEGRGAGEHQGLEAHLLVYLSGVRDGRRGFVGEEQNAAAGVLDDSGVLVGERRGKVAG